MPIARAMWTHGHAIRIEHPDRLINVWRAGFFVRLIGKPGENVWVHYAIPTPVITNDNRLSPSQAMIRCRTISEHDAWIQAVHVYDGENRIATHNGLHQVAESWSFLRYEIPDNPDVQWGVGLSINIHFTELMHLRPEYRELVERGLTDPDDLELFNAGRMWDAPGRGSSRHRPHESDEPRTPELHYTIEISSVGCDFAP